MNMNCFSAGCRPSTAKRKGEMTNSLKMAPFWASVDVSFDSLHLFFSALIWEVPVSRCFCMDFLSQRCGDLEAENRFK